MRRDCTLLQLILELHMCCLHMFVMLLLFSPFSLCVFFLPSLVYVSRRGPGQEYVKSTLGEILLKLIAYDKSLEVDPLKIYQEMIDNEEVRRPAEADKLLLEVSCELGYNRQGSVVYTIANKEILC